MIERDPLTAGKVCTIFRINFSTAKTVPALKHEAIYLKVFGAMEQARVLESRRCALKRHLPNTYTWVWPATFHSKRKAIADLAFSTLRNLYYGDSTSDELNWAF